MFCLCSFLLQVLSPLLSIDSLQNLFHPSKPSSSVMSTVTFLMLCLQNGMTPPPPASCSRVSRCWCRGPLLWHVAPALCWRLSPLWLVVFLFSPLVPSPWQTHGAVELNLVAHISEATVFVLTLWFLFLLCRNQCKFRGLYLLIVYMKCLTSGNYHPQTQS